MKKKRDEIKEGKRKNKSEGREGQEEGAVSIICVGFSINRDNGAEISHFR